MSKISRLFTDRNYRNIILAEKGFYNWMEDEKYIKMMFNARIGYPLNLEVPKTFNEKLQWLKLHDHNPLYPKLVDKYEVKKYVADMIGDQYIIPTIGVWNRFEDIDFSSLPDQFVLKCTHDSGGLVICKDKAKFDYKAAKRKIEKAMKRNYYYHGREWPYRDVPRKIICEKYMEDQSMQELRDYKFFCFGGIAKCYKVDFGRFIEHHANYYDMDNNMLTLGEKICPPIFEKKLELPETISEMKKLAEVLSKEIPFVRVDFYDIGGHVYFGELTFFPASGFGEFLTPDWDDKLGQWIKLPDISGGDMY